MTDEVDAPVRPHRPDGTASPAAARSWIGLAVLVLPCLVVSMNSNVLNLALPEIAETLKPSNSALLWIVDGYVFLMAGSLMTMGALADRVGRRRLLLCGAGGYAAASLLGAFSTSPGMLIGSRMLLGIAGATLMPSTLSLIRSMFLDTRQRTIALGIWTASFALGGVVGPVVGGLLLRHYWWGSVLLTAVPVMALLLATGRRLLPEFREPDPAAFDPAGALLSIAAVLLVVYGMQQLADGQPGIIPFTSIVAGVALAAAFVRRQRRSPDPAFDFGLIRLPTFGIPILANATAFFVLYGTQLLTVQYLQLVLGLTPLAAGLWTIPSALAYLVGSLLGSVIANRLRPAVMVGGCLLVAAAGFAILVGVGVDSGLMITVVGSVVFSIGLAPVYLVVTGLAISAAPVKQAGTASALLETVTSLGGALGIAVLGSIAGAVFRSEMGPVAPAGTSSQVWPTARQTIGGADSVARHLPAGSADELLLRAHAAFVAAFRAAEIVGTAMLVPTAIVVVLALRRIRSKVDS